MYDRGLVLCFRPGLCVHVICNFRLRTTSFTFFTFFKEKICVLDHSNYTVYDDTLDKEDVLVSFDELEVQNSQNVAAAQEKVVQLMGRKKV